MVPMQALLLVGVAGFLAQLVDGSLGMGYGLTSSTMLIAIGLAPVAASASVHLAEVGTTAASALAHHRYGNVDWAVVRRVAIPGAVGAFLGATLLANLSTAAARPWAAAVLFVLGWYVLLRFLRGGAVRPRPGTPGRRLLLPLGLVGGFVDATGGGGWGPVTTPTLLADGRMAPNRVIGTVNTAEFLVSLSASIGFLLGLGTEILQWDVLVPLLIGGVIAAPIAAWVVRHLPVAVLGVAVGAFIVFTNSFTLLKAFGAPGPVVAVVLGAVTVVGVVAVTVAVRRHRRLRRERVDVRDASADVAEEQTSEPLPAADPTR
jgi:uncharacterized membrane protein YfcA